MMVAEGGMESCVKAEQVRWGRGAGVVGRELRMGERGGVLRSE